MQLNGKNISMIGSIGLLNRKDLSWDSVEYAARRLSHEAEGTHAAVKSAESRQ